MPAAYPTPQPPAHLPGTTQDLASRNWGSQMLFPSPPLGDDVATQEWLQRIGAQYVGQQYLNHLKGMFPGMFPIATQPTRPMENTRMGAAGHIQHQLFPTPKASAQPMREQYQRQLAAGAGGGEWEERRVSQGGGRSESGEIHYEESVAE